MQDARRSLIAHAGLLSQLISRATGEDFRKAGITSGQFELLSAVRASGAKATQADVQRRLELAPASVSEAVKLAVHRGYLTQTRSEEDARLRLLQLTEAGSAKLDLVLSAVSRVESRMVDGIGDAELAAAAAVLQRVNRNLSRMK